MNWKIDKQINLATIIAICMLIITVILAFTSLQSDVKTFGMELERERQERERIDRRSQDIQATLRMDYMTREQIDYMIIQRMERMENIMNQGFKEIRETMERNGLQQDNIQRRDVQPRNE